jgi:signal transduction histidine kinase
MKILVVEDNLGDVRLLIEMFREQTPNDAEVTQASTMVEAEQHVAEHLFDIILLDLGLPDAQGLDAVRRTRAAAPHVPLVVLTASDSQSLAAQAVKEGAHDYLVKGQVDPRVLQRTLRLAVEREAHQRERNLLAEKLRQAQKMEVVGQLAAGVSHDFNNVLQIIMSGIDVLKDEKFISPHAHTFLNMIDRATERGSDLTNHLLSYSRKQRLDQTLLDVVEVLGNMRTLLSRTLGTDVVVTTRFAASPALVRTDRSQLETALMNIAINASHAMVDGGSLHFEVGNAEAEPFGEIKPGHYVVIAVTDTGTGMTAEVLASVFDPFFTTKGSSGTGLGLAMVQGFSRQSGGDVRVMSKLGEGTRLEIWLPQAEDDAQPAPPLQNTKNDMPCQCGRVLLVDDCSDVLVAIAAFLRTAGFTVFQALDGKQALAALADGERFDVLITDFMMPTMKGPELIKQARLFQLGLPALVISGFAGVSDALADLPGVMFLQKPFRRDQFIAQVNALVTRTGASASGRSGTENAVQPSKEAQLAGWRLSVDASDPPTVRPDLSGPTRGPLALRPS